MKRPDGTGTAVLVGFYWLGSSFWTGFRQEPNRWNRLLMETEPRTAVWIGGSFQSAIFVMTLPILEISSNFFRVFFSHDEPFQHARLKYEFCKLTGEDLGRSATQRSKPVISKIIPTSLPRPQEWLH